MKMPAKPAKPRKSASKPPKVPADQVMLKTQCGFCDVISGNPTTAQYHLAKEHPDEYAN
jgi:hypothetical protein